MKGWQKCFASYNLPLLEETRAGQSNKWKYQKTESEVSESGAAATST